MCDNDLVRFRNIIIVKKVNLYLLLETKSMDEYNNQVPIHYRLTSDEVAFILAKTYELYRRINRGYKIYG